MSCCSCISTFPECCAVKLCCFQCNSTNTPHLTADWLCTNHCLFCFHHFGFKEFWDTQLCCLGPWACCGSSKSSVAITTQLPDMFTINFLPLKCGIQQIPDWKKEDLIYERTLCCEQRITFFECLKDCQLLCCFCGPDRGPQRVVNKFSKLVGK